VPADAEVWIGDDKTTTTGAAREFVSPPLAPDGTFVYAVRARWQENGKEFDKTCQVDIRAGVRAIVDFAKPAELTKVNPRTSAGTLLAGPR
jgi:uncharacterized protein (TIGR03000 family)